MTTLRYTKNNDKKGLYTARIPQSLGILETQQINTIVVGDTGVGKSTLLQTYDCGTFSDYIAFGGQFLEPLVEVTLDATEFYFKLWDTQAQEEYEKLRSLSYRVAEIFWVCYSVKDRASFDNVSTKWLPELRQHTKTTPVVLVGMKTDLRSANNQNVEREPSDESKLSMKVVSKLDDGAEDLQKLRGDSSRGAAKCEVTYAQGFDLCFQRTLAGFAECSTKSGVGMEELKVVTTRAFKSYNEARSRRRCVVL